MLPPSPLLKRLSHRDEIGDWLNAAGLIGTGVEVGTLYGGYAKAILARWKGHLACVDLWRNQPGEVYQDGANILDLDAVWLSVLSDPVLRAANCHLKRQTSLEGAATYDDESLDFVYLDANHAVDAARADIAAWFRKVKIGGLFCGHDFYIRYDKDTNSDAQTAVMEFAELVGQWPQITWCNSWWFVVTQEMRDKLVNKRTFQLPACASTEIGPLHADDLITISFDQVGSTIKAGPAYATYKEPHSNANILLTPVLNVAGPDVHLAIKWLKWWAQLQNGSSAQSRRQLLVLCAGSLPESTLEKLRSAANGVSPPPIIKPLPIYENGYAASANFQFISALKMVDGFFPGTALLWCEADTVPMRANWVEEIEAEYQACEKPFMGDFVKQPRGIDHMTGIGVYHPDWRRFAPSLALLPGPRLEQGWDSMCAHEILPHAHKSITIQQTWRPPPITDFWVQKNIRPTTALFHQCKDGTLIDVLCARSGLTHIPLEKPYSPSTYPMTAIPDAANPRVAILIVTHAKDVEFLRYCLKSCKLYARGFMYVKVVVPRAEFKEFDWIRKEAIVEYFDQSTTNPMMHHEIQKCRADEWCADADFIVHMDADCAFFRQVTPAAYVQGGKCLSVRESYADIRNPNRFLWRDCVNRATGIVPLWDFMVRHCQVHPRLVYGLTRQAVEEHTGAEFDKYVLSCSGDFPQEFCEFNTISTVGQRLLEAAYNYDEYDHAADAAKCGMRPEEFQYLYRRDRDFLVETWSHGGIGMYRATLDSVTSGRVAEYFVK